MYLLFCHHPTFSVRDRTAPQRDSRLSSYMKAAHPLATTVLAKQLQSPPGSSSPRQKPQSPPHCQDMIARLLVIFLVLIRRGLLTPGFCQKLKASSRLFLRSSPRFQRRRRREHTQRSTTTKSVRVRSNNTRLGRRKHYLFIY